MIPFTSCPICLNRLDNVTQRYDTWMWYNCDDDNCPLDWIQGERQGSEYVFYIYKQRNYKSCTGRLFERWTVNGVLEDVMNWVEGKVE